MHRDLTPVHNFGPRTSAAQRSGVAAAMPAVGDRVVLKLDDVEGVVTRVSRPGWFMVMTSTATTPPSSSRRASCASSVHNRHSRKTTTPRYRLMAGPSRRTRENGNLAGGTYQTWLPPRGRKALRSRVEVRRYLASQQRSAPPTAPPPRSRRAWRGSSPATRSSSRRPSAGRAASARSRRRAAPSAGSTGRRPGGTC